MSLSLAAGAAIGAGVVDMGSRISQPLLEINQAKKNRAFQERMYKQQVEDNKNFWLMQQEFNLPKNVMRRLKDANLNPLLMYGDGGSSMVATSQPQAAQAPSGSKANIAPMGTNFTQAIQQASLIQAQIDNINANTRKTESETDAQKNTNWLFDQTKNVQIALKFRDYDYVNQLIDESRNRVFQSSFVNANEMAALTLQNNLAIRKQNLSEYEVGQNVLQGWQAVINGRISANAQLKSAAAALQRASNEARLVPYQIGLLRANAANINENTKFLQDTHEWRSGQEFQKMMRMRKENSWYDILQESGISEQQSRTFLNTLQQDKVFQDMEYKPLDAVTPLFNMLTGFGAGMIMNGNIGRVQVKGFGQ